MTAGAQPPTREERGRAYTRQLRWIGELQFAALFIAILAYSLLGLHKWSAGSAQDLTTNFYLQLIVCWTILWATCLVASVPAFLYRFSLDRKFNMANSGVFHRLMDFLKGNVFSFAFGATVVEAIFSCNILTPRYGWLLAGVLCSLAYVGVSSGALWLLSLFYPVLPLSNQLLADRLIRLSTKAGITVRPVLEWRISARTRAANALVAGISSSRRILLTDTLVSALSEDEVEAIVAHELGHCVLHHTRKRLIVQSLIFTGILGCIGFAVQHDLVTFVDKNMGWQDLTLLPGVFLYWTLGNIYGRLVLGAFARKNEREADLFSWRLIGRAEPFITAMRKLSDLNLIVFDKNSEGRYMHPPTADRIAAAEQFAKARGEQTGVSNVSVAASSES